MASNRDARWNMMMAALQGGLTFQKGLGAVHSMSHPLGGLKTPVLHHGTLNAVVLPAVLRFNATHVGEKIFALEAALNVPASSDLASFIEALNADIGLPRTLRAMGVTEDMIPRMIDGALKDHSTATNPRPLTRDDFEGLFAAGDGPGTDETAGIDQGDDVKVSAANMKIRREQSQAKPDAVRPCNSGGGKSRRRRLRSRRHRLPEQADSHHRAVRGRRHCRHLRPRDWNQADRGLGSAGDRRKQNRRGRKHWRRAGRKVAA